MPEPAGDPARPGVEWYADGLRFSCTQCGNCCTGPPGYVWFTEEEGEAVAKRFGLGFDAFMKKYARRVGDRWSFTEHLTEHGHDCVFLDRKSLPGKAVCGIYADRPEQCRTWPFWPENLESKGAWLTTKHATPCPGMDEGELHSLVEIRVVSGE
jgi:Fe-S-cluster containining protein